MLAACAAQYWRSGVVLLPGRRRVERRRGAPAGPRRVRMRAGAQTVAFLDGAGFDGLLGLGWTHGQGVRASGLASRGLCRIQQLLPVLGQRRRRPDQLWQFGGTGSRGETPFHPPEHTVSQLLLCHVTSPYYL